MGRRIDVSASTGPNFSNAALIDDAGERVGLERDLEGVVGVCESDGRGGYKSGLLKWTCFEDVDGSSSSDKWAASLDGEKMRDPGMRRGLDRRGARMGRGLVSERSLGDTG